MARGRISRGRKRALAEAVLRRIVRARRSRLDRRGGRKLSGIHSAMRLSAIVSPRPEGDGTPLPSGVPLYRPAERRVTSRFRARPRLAQTFRITTLQAVKEAQMAAGM